MAYGVQPALTRLPAVQMVEAFPTITTRASSHAESGRNAEIAERFDVSIRTVQRVRRLLTQLVELELVA